MSPDLTLIAARAVANAEGYAAKRLSRAEVISRNADVMADLARWGAQNRANDLAETVHHLCGYTARWAFTRDGRQRDAYNRLALSFVSLVRGLSLSRKKRAA